MLKLLRHGWLTFVGTGWGESVQKRVGMSMNYDSRIELEQRTRLKSADDNMKRITIVAT